VKLGLVAKGRTVVVDSTSHQLKFSNFQQMYFDNAFPPEFRIAARPELANKPVQLDASADAIAGYLRLKEK
jgi:threonine synthase